MFDANCSISVRTCVHGANKTGQPFAGDHAGIYCMKLCINMVLQASHNQFGR